MKGTERGPSDLLGIRVITNPLIPKDELWFCPPGVEPTHPLVEALREMYGVSRDVAFVVVAELTVLKKIEGLTWE